MHRKSRDCPDVQHIHCSVKSCAYNTDNDMCSLQAIHVAPCSGGNTGKPEDESNCASYEVK